MEESCAHNRKVSNIPKQDAENFDGQKGPTVTQTRINIYNTKKGIEITSCKPGEGSLHKILDECVPTPFSVHEPVK
jgi:hypothetical protein